MDQTKNSLTFKDDDTLGDITTTWIHLHFEKGYSAKIFYCLEHISMRKQHPVGGLVHNILALIADAQQLLFNIMQKIRSPMMY